MCLRDIKESGFIVLQLYCVLKCLSLYFVCFSHFPNLVVKCYQNKPCLGFTPHGVCGLLCLVQYLNPGYRIKGKSLNRDSSRIADS